MIKDLIKQTRSYRRFYEDKKMTIADLKELVDCARISASAGNKQPIRYMLFADEKKNAEIFPSLHWAGYLTDWDGPVEGERPTGYIFIVEPEGVNAMQDEGIAAQTIMLAATEKGFGGCMLGAIDRPVLANVVGLPAGYQIKLVLALGVPKEEVMLEDIPAAGDIKYYRDEKAVHHVPKIKLEDVILN